MKVIKRKTGCYCSNCDQREALYELSNNGSFKLSWAKGAEDCEIAFCEDCAKELFKQLADALGVEVSTPDEDPSLSSDVLLYIEANNPTPKDFLRAMMNEVTLSRNRALGYLWQYFCFKCPYAELETMVDAYFAQS